MLKVDRIGTPTFFKSAYVAADMTDNDMDEVAHTSIFGSFNSINAAAPTGHEIARLASDDTFDRPTNLKMGFLQQFTLARPRYGNAVCVELQGSLSMLLPVSWRLQPIVTKLSGAASSVLGQITPAIPPVDLCQEMGEQVGVGSAITNNRMRTVFWKSQVMFTEEADADDLSGVYAHGVQIVSDSAGTAIGSLRTTMAFRNIEIPTSIRYFDPIKN